jgi:hypothetical protein
MLPFGTVLFLADGRRHMTKLTVAFLCFANASENRGMLRLLAGFTLNSNVKSLVTQCVKIVYKTPRYS